MLYIPVDVVAGLKMKTITTDSFLPGSVIEDHLVGVSQNAKILLSACTQADDVAASEFQLPAEVCVNHQQG